MKKPIFYTELSYLLGIITLALGASLMVKADLGISVVVAPTYLIHLKLSQTWSFVTFGVAEYIVQAFLLILLTLLVRRFHWCYLCSFATALCYGFFLDTILAAFALFSITHIGMKILFFILGLLVCAVGISLFFHTYLSPEVYELLVKEVTAKYHWKLSIVKTIYDCISCLIAVIFSFSFFGLFHFRGVGIGTVISALLNGKLIAVINRFLDDRFTFRSAFPSFEHYFAPPPFPERSNAKKQKL